MNEGKRLFLYKAANMAALPDGGISGIQEWWSPYTRYRQCSWMTHNIEPSRING